MEYPDSPEGVTFALFHIIANIEGWALANGELPPSIKLAQHATPVRAQVLDLYDECRRTVLGMRPSVPGCGRH